MSCKRGTAAVLGVLILCLVGLPLFAQTVTGTLSGRVVDSTGAVIPGAKLQIKGEQTGLVRDTVANDEGYYVFTFVPLGTYELKASSSGFKTVQKQRVEVALNQTTVSDFKLEPASTSEVVTISGELPLIETGSSDIKGTFGAKEVEDRPLPTRNFLYFTETVPGFQENPVSGQNNPTLSSGSSVNFNGMGTRGATFQINGVNNDDSSENQNRQGVNVSTIQNVQVLTNNFSSEFGRGYGTVVLVQTKQGTNNYHGDLFWFHINSATQARDFFNPVTVTDPYTGQVSPFRIPSNRKHDFGGTIGGPIRKDKLFFYGSLEDVRNGGGAVFRRDILYPWERQPDPSVTDPRDRAWIQNIIDAFPNAAPNDPAFGPRAYTTGVKFHYPTEDYSGRIDWNVSNKSTFTARYQRSHQNYQTDEVIKYEQTVQNNTQHNLGITFSHTFTPMQTGEFRLGVGRRETQVDVKDALIDNPFGKMIPVIRVSNPNNPISYCCGTIIGNAGALPIHRFQTDWQFVYNHFWVATPKVTLKAGTDVRPSQLNDFADSFTRGYWRIRDQGLPVGGVYHDAYWSLLHGMFGRTADGAGFTKSYGQPDLANDMKEANFYLQADLKLTPALTLMLGFRNEWVAATTERNHKIDYGYNDTNNPAPRIGFAYSPQFDTGLIAKITGGPGKMAIRGGYGIFSGRLFQSFFNQAGASLRFTPPFGLDPVWDITAEQRTYVPGFISDPTGGYQFSLGTWPQRRISFTEVDPNLRTPYAEQWNFSIQREITSTMGLNVAYVGSRGLGLPFYNSINRSPFPTTAPAAVFSGSTNDMIVTYNGVPTNFAGVTFDCVDPNLANANPIKNPVTGNQCISLAQPFTNQRRPDPHFGGIFLIRNGNDSWYNALQLDLKKRASHGLLFDVGYTFGKALDTGSETTYTGIESNVPITMYDDARLNKGYSMFDTRHRFTIDSSYELPFFKNERVTALGDGMLASAVGKVVGGWQLSGTYIWASGTPINVLAGYDLNADGVNNDRPDILDTSYLGASISDGHTVNGVQVSTTQVPNSIFYPNATTTTAARIFRPGLTNRGSLPRNAFRADGRNNLDAALQKNFRVSEGTKLMFRWEVYNVANHPQFYLPNSGWVQSNYKDFGRIYGTRNNRVDTATGSRYMQFAFRYVF